MFNKIICVEEMLNARFLLMSLHCVKKYILSHVPGIYFIDIGCKFFKNILCLMVEVAMF
jgi:hypothetical protein